MNKLYLFALGFAVAAGFAAINYAASCEIRAVQAGKVKLVCVMKDGERVIDPNKVVDLADGVWLLRNGHAKNCEVIKGGDL